MQLDKIRKIYENRLLSQKPSLEKSNIQLNYILKYLSENREHVILDAGCGNGNYSFYLSSLGYKNIYAVDLFSNIQTSFFKYQQESIDQLSFKDEYFDLVFSNSVIFYLKNPNDGIKEFNRVLKNNGILLFTAHTKYSFFTLWRIIKRDFFRVKSMEHLKDVNFQSANYYKKLLQKNGFEIVLQDGYNISFFIYPVYQKIVKGFKKYFNIKLPLLKPYLNKGLIGKIKSEIAYHSVFVVRKRSD